MKNIFKTLIVVGILGVLPPPGSMASAQEMPCGKRTPFQVPGEKEKAVFDEALAKHVGMKLTPCAVSQETVCACRCHCGADCKCCQGCQTGGACTCPKDCACCESTRDACCAECKTVGSCVCAANCPCCAERTACYRFLCFTSTTTHPPRTGSAVVDIHVTPDGKIKNKKIVPVRPLNMPGAWTGFKLPDEQAEKVFEKTLAGKNGGGWKPLCVATQVVAGRNYRFLCYRPESKDPDVKNNACGVVYVDLKGEMSITEFTECHPREIMHRFQGKPHPPQPHHDLQSVDIDDHHTHVPADDGSPSPHPRDMAPPREPGIDP